MVTGTGMETNDEFGRPKVHYVCGSCGKDNTLDENAVIRCYNCGHRIFYKKRERKLLQYEARWELLLIKNLLLSLFFGELAIFNFILNLQLDAPPIWCFLKPSFDL
jgi:DNA-directed RNA polymerase I, II, and III subunit RPABC4